MTFRKSIEIREDPMRPTLPSVLGIVIACSLTALAQAPAPQGAPPPPLPNCPELATALRTVAATSGSSRTPRRTATSISITFPR